MKMKIFNFLSKITLENLSKKTSVVADHKNTAVQWGRWNCCHCEKIWKKSEKISNFQKAELERDNVDEICKEVSKQIWLTKKHWKYPTGVLKYVCYTNKCSNDLCFNVCKEYIDSLFEKFFN